MRIESSDSGQRFKNDDWQRNEKNSVISDDNNLQNKPGDKLRKKMMNILFISSGRNGLSLISKSIAEQELPGDFRVECAVTDSEKPNEGVLKALKKKGFNIAEASSQFVTINKIINSDVIVTFEECIIEPWQALPGNPSIIHWSDFSYDREREGNEEFADERYEDMRRRLEVKIKDLLMKGNINVLKSNRIKWLSYLENADSAMVIHDQHGRITYFNRSAELIFGYSREEVLGKECRKVFPRSLCGSECPFYEAASNSFDAFRYFRQIELRNGKRRPAEISIMPIRNCNEKVIGAVVSIRDFERSEKKKTRYNPKNHFMGVVGKSSLIREIFENIKDVGPTDVSVLIQGESGTGKELVAEAIHKISKRRKKTFVVINCGAIPEGLLESELFGHVKGAFTGAVRDKKGRFELADGGTIFLDEIGELSLFMQVKILRVLQSGVFSSVGSEQTKKVDVRVISATNRNLEELMRKRKFREDLYYRVCGFPITLPPLRERLDDIDLLVDFFLQGLATEFGRKITCSPDFLSALRDFSWPGNIRQLQNALQYAAIKCKSITLESCHLPHYISKKSSEKEKQPKAGRPKKLSREIVLDALKQTGGNKVKAAALLKIGRATLYRYLKK